MTRQDRRVRILIVVVWAWVVLPRALQSVMAPKFRRSAGIDYGGYVPMAGLAREALLVAAVGAALWVLVQSFRRPVPLRPLPLIIMLAPWLYLVVRDMYVDGGPPTSALLYPLVVVALWASRPSVSTLRTLGNLTLLAVIMAMAMAVVDPSSALFRSNQGTLISEDKQILPSGMLAGFLTQPNNLGQFVAMGIPMVGFLPRRWQRLTGLAVCAFGIVWTASRSSMYAVGITLAATLAFTLVRSHTARRAVAIGTVAAAFVIVGVLPFATSDPLAFSQRGGIWQASLAAWRDSPWLGQGANWYRSLAGTSSSIGTYAFHAHNQFLQLLVTGGIWYALLIGVMFWLVAVQAVRFSGNGLSTPFLYLVALAGTCLLEVSLAVVDNESMFPMVVIPLTIICCARETRGSPLAFSNGKSLVPADSR